jgi:hypothetical protein
MTLEEAFAAIDEAAREPVEGWRAADRFPVGDAADRAKELLVALAEPLPSCVDYDAQGGIAFEWGDNLDVSVFDDVVTMIRRTPGGERYVAVRPHAAAVEAVRAARAEVTT